MFARALERLRRRRTCTQRDGGFVLLESIITISLITIVMSAIGTEFVGSITAVSTQRAKQLAAQVADSQVENIRALPASALSGAAIWSPFSSASASLRTTWLANMDDAGGAVAPAQLTQQQGSLTYHINNYLGWCYVPADGSSTDCRPAAALPSGVTGIKYLRVVVSVTWSGAHCNPTSCSYVTATLTSAATDPTFKVNQPLPPAPGIATPSTQVSAIGDSVNLQLLVKAGTGVPMFTWSATGLPPGLSMSTSGLIQGTVDKSAQVSPPGYSVTVTVWDMFVRSATATFSWQILPQLIANNPDQASYFGTALSPAVRLTATGGAGAPYTWSDPNGTLPPGLSVSSGGAVTGTPTKVGTYSVAVVVTDSSGSRSTTSKFTWNITYPPLKLVNPGTQTSTLNTAVSGVPLTANGGSGSYAWSASGLPPGVSVNNGLISGTPSATGSYTVTATVTDAQANATQGTTFTWNVVAAPTIAAPAVQTTTEGKAVSVPVGYTCPNGPCAITLRGTAPGVGLSTSANYSGNNTAMSLQVVSGSGTVYLTGTVQPKASAGSPYSVQVTVTDAAGASTAATSTAWTINPPPVVSPPPTSAFAPGSAVTGQATASGGTPGYTYALSGNPAWLTINAANGVLSGKAPATRGKVGPVTVTATDSAGIAATATFTWYVDDLAWSTIPDQSTTHSRSAKRPNTGSLDLAGYSTGGSATKTYAIVSGPSWVTLSGSTLTATAPTNTTSATVIVKVTDSVGYAILAQFTWTIT